MDCSRNLGSESAAPSGPTGHVLASGNNGASLPAPPPPPATSQDQVCAKTSPSLLSAAVPPLVRVVGAINGRWFSFSGFGFGGENSVARQATRAAFRELKGKRTNEQEREDVAAADRDLWPASAPSPSFLPSFFPSFLPSFRRVWCFLLNLEFSPALRIGRPELYALLPLLYFIFYVFFG